MIFVSEIYILIFNCLNLKFLEIISSMKKVYRISIFVFFIMLLFGLYITYKALNHGSQYDQEPDLFSSLHTVGPIQKGHAKLTCRDCHTPAKGTVRQQLQALAHNVLFEDKYPQDFGFKAITSDICLDCHRRPNERHPIHRFKEFRFQEAIAEIDARSCLTCHDEHSGGRLHILKELTFCSACHGDLNLKNDPVTPRHDILIQDKDWESCLTCHDFHGNHKYKVPLNYSERIDSYLIEDYARDGADPYSAVKEYLGETQRK